MTVSVKLEACNPEDCAKLAYQNVQKAATKLGQHADTVENLEKAAKHIKESGLPQAFVESIKKLDTVVSVIDQFADVSLCIFQKTIFI